MRLIGFAGLLALFMLVATPAFAQSKLCPTGGELDRQAAYGVRNSTHYSKANVRKAWATLVWHEHGDKLWQGAWTSGFDDDVHFAVAFAFRWGNLEYKKSKKTYKRLIKYRDANIAAGKILPRPKNVPAGPTQAALEQAASVLACRIEPSASQSEREAQYRERRSGRPCKLGGQTYELFNHDRDREKLPSDKYGDRYKHIAMGIIDWQDRGAAFFDDDERRHVQDLSHSEIPFLLRKGFYRAAYTDPVPAFPDLSKALDAHHQSGVPLPTAFAAPPPEYLDWAEGQLRCEYDPEAWAPIGEQIDRTIRFDAERRRQAEVRMRNERNAFLRERGWFDAPASKAEPRGGVEEVSNRPQYRGFRPETCDGYYNGLKEKPVLTSFEREWGAWFTHHRTPGTRCKFRPVERYFTARERDMIAFKDRQNEILKEELAAREAFRAKYGTDPQSFDEILSDHMERGERNREQRDSLLECERKYGVGNCTGID